MSGQVGRWRVPYSAPGSRGGFLVVEAASREDAINKAIARHSKRFNRMGNPSWALTRAQRVAIDYGEPEFVGEARA